MFSDEQVAWLFVTVAASVLTAGFFGAGVPEADGGDSGGNGTETRPAEIRMRLKGRKDGPVFRGQELVRPCKSCGP
jgi:hypothetical protein